jgi:hypothetical protein
MMEEKSNKLAKVDAFMATLGNLMVSASHESQHGTLKLKIKTLSKRNNP